jgi:hypothetical protein
MGTQTPTLPPAPVGVPAWLVRFAAAALAVVGPIFGWLDPGNTLPKGAVQAVVILAFLIVGALIFIIHLVLSATHEYGWNMKAAGDIETQADAEFKQLWPEMRTAFEAAKPALDTVSGVNSAVTSLSADVADLKTKVEKSGMTPHQLVEMFEQATGMSFPNKA